MVCFGPEIEYKISYNMEWYKDGCYPEWHIMGQYFSPKELIKQYPELLLISRHEKNDLGDKGRYKGKIYGYGSCTVIVKEEVINKLDWLLDFILKNQSTIRHLGVEEELLWIRWYGRQGNMELGISQINKIQKTGNPLNMNYYYNNE